MRQRGRSRVAHWFAADAVLLVFACSLCAVLFYESGRRWEAGCPVKVLVQMLYVEDVLGDKVEEKA